MSGLTSRLNRDVRSETSVFNRDVRSQRHASTVTFERAPSFLSVRLNRNNQDHLSTTRADLSPAGWDRDEERSEEEAGSKDRCHLRAVS